MEGENMLEVQFTKVEDIPVDILKVGFKKDNPDLLILIIPGNPGLVGYYETFALALYEKLDGYAEVWALSHACHSQEEVDSSLLNTFSPLELEVIQKLWFLLKGVPKETRLILIGHSIGCFMIQCILEVLSDIHVHDKYNLFNANKDYIDVMFKETAKYDLLNRISKCYFMFPTIERMRQSPSGRELWPILCYAQWLVEALMVLLNYLPLSLKSKLASFILGRKCSDPSMIKPTIQLTCPKNFSSMLSLAYDELLKVDELHNEVLQMFKDKILFYFGMNDRWCPLSYKRDMEEKIPGICTMVDELQADHAFVLGHSLSIATFVASNIMKD